MRYKIRLLIYCFSFLNVSIKWSESCSVMSNSLQPHVQYSPWISPGQNTGVGSLSLLQGISPTQGLNPGLLHSRWILYQLSHKGGPRILEWAGYHFSRASSWPRNLTRLSCITCRFFTNWAIREAQSNWQLWISCRILPLLHLLSFDVLCFHLSLGILIASENFTQRWAQ